MERIRASSMPPVWTPRPPRETIQPPEGGRGWGAPKGAPHRRLVSGSRSEVHVAHAAATGHPGGHGGLLLGLVGDDGLSGEEQRRDRRRVLQRRARHLR